MPRRSAIEAQRTKETITRRASDVASLEGLERLTIGRLAGDLEMSKAGVIGHFGTKEALQLATLEDAIARFTEHVWLPAATSPAGVERLRTIVRAWSTYLTDGTFPGGCFLTAASFEFDGRSGAVRDRIASALRQWTEVLVDEVRTAVDAGELPADTDPEQVAFELQALAAGATQTAQLHHDPASSRRCRHGMQRCLGLA